MTPRGRLAVFVLAVVLTAPAALRAQTPPADASPVCNVCDPEAARVPFSQEIIVTIPAGKTQLAWPGSQVVGLTVPAGYRYVVQHVSAQGVFPAGQKFRVNLFAASFSSFARLQLLPTRVWGTASSAEWVASEAMRIDLDPGYQLAVELKRSSSAGTGSLLVYVSGYTIPLP
jgi:hypothetical protein